MKTNENIHLLNGGANAEVLITERTNTEARETKLLKNNFNKLEKKLSNLETEALNINNVNDLKEKIRIIEKINHQLHDLASEIWKTKPKNDKDNEFRQQYDILLETMKNHFTTKSHILGKLMSMEKGMVAYHELKKEWKPEDYDNNW